VADDAAAVGTWRDRRIAPATVAIVATAVAVFVFGPFLLAQILGIRRVTELALLVPIGGAAAYYLWWQPRLLRHPLILFALVKLVLEIFWRSNFLYVSEACASLAGLIVVWGVGRRSLRIGARVVVALATLLAVMGLLEWVLLFIVPAWGTGIPFSPEGPVEVSAAHPITFLGLFLQQGWTFLGRPVVRLQSFSREPSLNLVFFCLPACLALYLNGPYARRDAAFMLAFSILSFSGSVYLSLAFAVFWWALARAIPVRVILPWAVLILTAVYLATIMTAGVGWFLSFSAGLRSVSTLLVKSASITGRALPAIANFWVAVVSPFGSPVLSDASGPLYVNAALAAGWPGLICLTMFFAALGRQMDTQFRRFRWSLSFETATFVLLGSITTVVSFSDYAMTTYPGLILLMFLSRVIRQGPEVEPRRVARSFRWTLRPSRPATAPLGATSVSSCAVPRWTADPL
jgi:hypothetical protein